jgi:hypothetical protein
MGDVVQTRIMIRGERDSDEVSQTHAWAFACQGARLVNALTLSVLIGQDFLVEIEAEAVLGCCSSRHIIYTV